MNAPLKSAGQQKLDKRRADEARLLRAWKKFHRDEREAVLTGPHRAVMAELFRMLANLKHVWPPQLIGFVRSIDWPAIDYATRLIVIHETSEAITGFREKRGLPPLDDNLPGEPDTPFRAIRSIVLAPSHEDTVSCASSEEPATRRLNSRSSTAR
jgi:hypothetical protein